MYNYKIKTSFFSPSINFMEELLFKWRHTGNLFCYPQVAESIQESIEEIKNKQEDIQRMKSDLGLAGDNDAESALSNLR